MHFLVDADLPRRTVTLLQSLGHEAVDVRDIGMGKSPDSDIASHARRHGFTLITGDFDFADIRNYPPEKYSGIVVLTIPTDATAREILAMVGAFAGEPQFIKRLSGRLAVVEHGRVRFRPA